ncbi:MAG: cbb3-type cytochrome oxidase subunit 3 [Gammaproteobacteria bacterium]
MQYLATIQSIWTVIVFVIFVGIVFWAWSGKNKADFEEAAQIPLNDEVENNSNDQKADKKESLNG